jgi:ketosteroid isomerase-like protein
MVIILNSPTPPIYNIKDWLIEFESSVNNLDFERALSLYVESALLFGTRVSISSDIHDYVDKQWRPIWNASTNFKFTAIELIIESEDLQICAVLWSNSTKIKMRTLARKGRATLIFRKSDGGLKAIHSHFSQNP